MWASEPGTVAQNNKPEVSMDYKIRELRQSEILILDVFLYEAIYVPEGTTAPPRDIIKQPELQVYVADFGKQKGDICYVAEIGNSLLKEYRNYGIGTELMKRMLSELKEQGYKQTSLSVQKMNYAVGMYKKVGFEIIDENNEEYLMVCKL